MSTTTARSTNIVVGFDFSEQAHLALRYGLARARIDESSTIHIIGVLEPTKGLGRLTHDKVDFAAAEAAQHGIEEAVGREAGNIESEHFAIFIHTRIGKPVDEIIRLADETDADLVIVGTHGRTGLDRLVMGSVAEHVMRRAGCPVLVMRPVEHRAVHEPADVSLRPEPPCPACVNRRFETRGAEWWCEEHAAVHPGPTIQIGSRHAPSMADWQRYNQ